MRAQSGLSVPPPPVVLSHVWTDTTQGEIRLPVRPALLGTHATWLGTLLLLAPTDFTPQRVRLRVTSVRWVCSAPLPTRRLSSTVPWELSVLASRWPAHRVMQALSVPRPQQLLKHPVLLAISVLVHRYHAQYVQRATRVPQPPRR